MLLQRIAVVRQVSDELLSVCVFARVCVGSMPSIMGSRHRVGSWCCSINGCAVGTWRFLRE